MNIYTIYRATNIITGLQYIGFTSESLRRRSMGHRRDALEHNSQAKFHKAIREHGWEAFTWEIIYQAKEELSPTKSHTCKVMEDHFINEHDSLNNGYNSAPGGGAWPIMKGKDHPLYNVGHSDAAKQRIKDNHHDVGGSNNPMYGKKGKDNPKSIKFWAIDPQGNRHEDIGISQFCEKHKLIGPNVIGVLKGSRKQHKGWRFGYL